MTNVLSVDAVRGIIQTPNYPVYQTNINTTLTINVNGANKYVNIYNVNTYIQAPTLLQV